MFNNPQKMLSDLRSIQAQIQVERAAETEAVANELQASGIERTKAWSHAQNIVAQRQEVKRQEIERIQPRPGKSAAEIENARVRRALGAD